MLQQAKKLRSFIKGTEGEMSQFSILHLKSTTHRNVLVQLCEFNQLPLLSEEPL
jgi:hypothetical protein